MPLACRALWLATLMLATLAGVRSAPAQTVQLQRGNRGLPIADEVVDSVIRRGRYRVIARDTILPAAQRIDADVIVLRATLRVEGTIVGDLVAVESDVFMRPGSHVGGAVVVLNGGFYGSSLAELSRPPIDGSHYAYRVSGPRDGRYTVSAPGGSASPRLLGLKGVLLPRYDRVNAITLPVGVALDRGRNQLIPYIEAQGRWRTARGRIDGDLYLEWAAGRNSFFIAGGRTVRTNDAWILGNIGNSLTSLVLSADYRDYYDAKFGRAGARLAYGQSVRWRHALVFDFEAASSLENKSPFSLFDYRSGFRPNPTIDDGDIGSLALTTTLEAWPRPFSTFELEIALEGASREILGDFTYGRVSGALNAELPLAERHSLTLLARGQGMGGSDSPAQRWRALGGERTVPTLGRLERRGDQMWWTELSYLFDSGYRLGALGDFILWATYAAGDAWVREGTRLGSVHNVGAGVNLGSVFVGVFTAPGDDFDTVVSVGISRQR